MRLTLEDETKAPIADELSVVLATATARKVGTFTKPDAVKAWDAIAHVARTLAWVSYVELTGYDLLHGDDASAATQCAALLEQFIVGRTDAQKAGGANIVCPLLERSDAAVLALGGTLAVKVAR
jgi:prophage tail gpP-like protein